MKKTVWLSTPCYNEEGNVRNLYNACKAVMETLPQYEYKHLFIDNCSEDGTRGILRQLAAEDPEHVRVIFNERNFGPDRSSAYGVYACEGDCVITLAADLQDPPALIPDFLKKWEEGYDVVWGQKTSSQEKSSMYFIRGLYYKIIKSFSEVKQYEQVTGFGLYDQRVVKAMEACREPDPLFRNLVTDMGFHVALLAYEQPARQSGKSSYNFIRYLDTAISSLINTSKAPVRLSCIAGAVCCMLSVFAAVVMLILKLIFWDSFTGILAPLMLFIFFLWSAQLLVIGMVGEYVIATNERVKKRPLVIEEERINF